MNDLAQALAALDLAAYPPATQAYVMSVLAALAAGTNGVSVATSTAGSALPPPVAGDLNIALIQEQPTPSQLVFGFDVVALQGTANGPMFAGSAPILLLASPSGNDVVSGPSDGATLVGGAGADTLVAGNTTSVITHPGTAGGSVLIDQNPAAGRGSDTVFAAGPVLVSAQTADLFFINGAGGSTVLGGGLGRSVIDGGAGGGLFAAGGEGGSVLYGGTGASTLFGAAGGDLLLAGGAQADALVAGRGNETLSGLGSTGAVTYYGGAGADLMGGGSGAQTFISGGGSDTMIGGAGGDLFVGGPGDDVMFGGTGQDTFLAGAGQGTIVAGPGADLFGFNAAMANGLATTDIFGFGGADRIVLQGYDSVSLAYALAHATVAGGSTTLTLPSPFAADDLNQATMGHGGGSLPSLPPLPAAQTIVLEGVTSLTSAAFA